MRDGVASPPSCPADAGELSTRGLIFHAIFWAAFVFLGFPSTYWDDSLIVGPAVALAENGQLTNIYLSRAFYPDTFYLFYPPTFFYVLAGWITAFGKSVLSLSGFWAATGLVSSAAVAVLLGRFVRGAAGWGTVVWIVAPVLVFGCIAYTGYRYEMLGFATLLAGLVLGTGRRRRIGYFLLFLTPTISPTMLGASFVAAAAVFAHHQRGRLRAEILIAGTGLAAAVLVLAAGVLGDVGGLVSTMYRFRDVRVGVGLYNGSSYAYLLPVMLAGVGAAAIQRVFLGRPLTRIEVQLPLLLVLAMQLTLLAHLRPAMLVAFNIALVTVLIISVGQLWSQKSGRQTAPAIGLGIWGIVLAVLNIGYLRSVALPPLSQDLVKVARESVATAPSGAIVVADPRVIKEALGYPAHMRLEDSMLRQAWPAFRQDYHQIPVHEYWVMTRSMLETLMYFQQPHATRGVLDNFLIATGFGASASDQICAFDSATSQAWRSEDPADFIAAACRPGSAAGRPAG
jgi:hypothetical protein